MNYQLPLIQDEKLRLRALTHRSYVNEHSEVTAHNERLEFLGDAVLGFIVGELLYQQIDLNQLELSEAKMTRLRASLVDEKQLTQFALQLGLGKLIYLGKGAIKDGGRESPAVLSDAFEAYIGAYYLDQGIDAVRDFIIPLLTPVLNQRMGSDFSANATNLVDYKNRFQQWALKELKQTPKYYIVDESGQDHNKEFTAQVQVEGKVYGMGSGKRKQDAQKQAAKDALRKLRLET
ncbi:MAG: ribonuclease III [Microcoleaceae cyanobacterium]